nr:hypothetical protein [Massilia cavernae]
MPPSSSDTRFKSGTLAASTARPVAVEPVKATFAMPAWLANAAPTSPPPVTTDNTTPGREAIKPICASRNAVKG